MRSVGIRRSSGRQGSRRDGGVTNVLDDQLNTNIMRGWDDRYYGLQASALYGWSGTMTY
jgi:hypothetical protein